MSSQETTLELARQGNPDAIATLINSQLQPKGITAQVTLQESRLQVLLTSGKALNQETLVPYIQKGVAALGIESISEIKISGQQMPDSSPSWSQDVLLNSPPVAPEVEALNDLSNPSNADSGLTDLERAASDDALTNLNNEELLEALTGLEVITSLETSNADLLDLGLIDTASHPPSEEPSATEPNFPEDLNFDLSNSASTDLSNQDFEEILGAASTDLDPDFDLADLSSGSNDTDPLFPLAELDEAEPAPSDLSDFDLSDFPLSESSESISLDDLESPTASPSNSTDFGLEEFSLEADSEQSLTDELDQDFSLDDLDGPDTPSSDLVDLDLSDFPSVDSASTDSFLANLSSPASSADALDLDDVSASGSAGEIDFDLSALSFSDEADQPLDLSAFEEIPADPSEAADFDLADLSLADESTPSLSLDDFDVPEASASAEIIDFDLTNLSLADEPDQKLSLPKLETSEAATTEDSLDFDLDDLSLDESSSPANALEDLAGPAASSADLSDDLWLNQETSADPPHSTDVSATTTEATDLDFSDFPPLDLDEADDSDLSLTGLEVSNLDSIEDDLWLNQESSSASASADLEVTEPAATSTTDDLDFSDFPPLDIDESTEPDLSFTGLDIPGLDAAEPAATSATDDLDFSDFPPLDIDESAEPDLSFTGLETPGLNSVEGDLWISQESSTAFPTNLEASEPITEPVDLDLSDFPSIESDTTSEPDFSLDLLDTPETGSVGIPDLSLDLPSDEALERSQSATEPPDDFADFPPLEADEAAYSDFSLDLLDTPEAGSVDIPDLSLDFPLIESLENSQSATEPPDDFADFPPLEASDTAEPDLALNSLDVLDISDASTEIPDLGLELSSEDLSENLADLEDPLAVVETSDLEASVDQPDTTSWESLAAEDDSPVDLPTPDLVNLNEPAFGNAEFAIASSPEDDLDLLDLSVPESDFESPDLGWNEVVEPETVSGAMAEVGLGEDWAALDTPDLSSNSLDLDDTNLSLDEPDEFEQASYSTPYLEDADAALDPFATAETEEPRVIDFADPFSASIGTDSVEEPSVSPAEQQSLETSNVTEAGFDLPEASSFADAVEPEDWADASSFADAVGTDEGTSETYEPSSFADAVYGTDEEDTANLLQDLPEDLVNWQDPFAETEEPAFSDSLGSSGFESPNGAPLYEESMVSLEDTAASDPEPPQDIFVFDNEDLGTASNGQMTSEELGTPAASPFSPSDTDAFPTVNTFPAEEDALASSSAGRKRLLPLIGGLGVVLIALVAFGLYKVRGPESAVPEAQQPPTQPTAPPNPQPTPTAAPPPASGDPFRDAVNAAGEASQLAQTAKTEDEWKQVTDAWQRSIDLMKQVPTSSPKYAIAQQKVLEYQPRLLYAQQTTARLAAGVPSQ